MNTIERFKKRRGKPTEAHIQEAALAFEKLQNYKTTQLKGLK